MCNDDIRNYNSKISDLGYLTLKSIEKGVVFIEHRVVFM